MSPAANWAIFALLCCTAAGLFCWQRRRARMLRQFAAGIDAISGNFSLWDKSDRLLIFNRVFKKDVERVPGAAKSGLSFEEYIRSRVHGGLVRDAAGDEENWIEKRLLSHRKSSHLFEVKLQDGTWHLVEERTTALGGLVVYGIDISDLKNSQEALARSKQRFRDFAAAGADWFWETDADHRFCFFSDNLEEQVGIKVADLIGKRRDETAPAAADPELWAEHIAALHRHEVFREFTFKRDISGERELWTSVSGVPHFTKEGAFAGYRGVGRDVTELVEARRALEASEEQSRAFAELQKEARLTADRANRAKSDFLASMSHEFRTPLNAILGFGQLLKLEKREDLSPAQTEYVEHILSSGEHLLNLVNEVLDFASIEANSLTVSKKVYDAQELVERIVRTMQPIAGKSDVRLEEAHEAGPKFILADAQRMRQILMNLISNAIKYNKPGGVVTVKAETVAGNVRVSVADTGHGIARERQAAIFEPFNRLGAENTSIEGAGLGLGLALSRRLALAMGGDIDFRSEPGAGSEFWVEFPLQPAEAGAA